MKRDLPSSSIDSYKPPNPSKKNPTLELFFKVEKSTNQEQSMEKIAKPVKQEEKLEKIKCESSEQGSSNNSAKNKYPKLQTNDSRQNLVEQRKNQLQSQDKDNCMEVPISQNQQDYLMKKYLNKDWDYACQECLRDITNYTKIMVDDKIYCPGCAVQFVKTDYTVIRALHDMQFIDFKHEKQEGSVSEFIWSIKDELMLIQASELYGMESYELIRNHMKSEHPIEEIKYQQEYFIQKFLSSKKKQQKNEQKKENSTSSHSVDIEIDIGSQDESTDEKFFSVKEVSKRNQKILRLLKYNQKTGDFEYQMEPGYYEMIASQITKDDLKNRPQMVNLVIAGRKNEISQVQILQKALKRKLLSKKARSEDDQEPEEQESQLKSKDEQIKEKQERPHKEERKNDENQNNDDEDIEDQGDENEDDSECEDYMNLLAYLTEKEKWTLLRCQLISEYQIKDPDTNSSLNKIMEKIKLIDQRNEAIAEALQDEHNINVVLEKKNNIRMTIKQFRRVLPPDVVRMIFEYKDVKGFDLVKPKK